MASKCKQTAHNKGAAARLQLTDPLRPGVPAVGLSRSYLQPNEHELTLLLFRLSIPFAKRNPNP